MRRFFNIYKSDNAASAALFLLRLVFGLFMMTHGYDKLIHFNRMVQAFPDPLRMTSRLSLMATIFAEFFCSGLVVLGFFTRLATLPIVFCMAVAAVVINGDKPLLQHELAPLYLTTFLAICLLGPGTVSIDAIMQKKR